jgi:hypothetical protein
MGDGENIGVLGYQDNANGTAAGYFVDVSGDTAELAAGAVTGGYFDDASGDETFVAAAGYAILSLATKSTMVKDENNKYRSMFCDESPEIVFHDYGTATLVNGKVHVNLDPLFAKTVAINDKHPLRVMVTLNDQCNGVYVTHRTATGFDVMELSNGTSNAEFTYEVIANRADRKASNGTTFDYSNWRYPYSPTMKSLKSAAPVKANPGGTNNKLQLNGSNTQK